MRTSITLLFVVLSSSPMCGQSAGVTDSNTPPGIAGGEPAGAYALSGFDTVNLFSGNLNFHLPLYTVKGRGEARYTMVLPVERRWNIQAQLGNDGRPSGNYFALTNMSPRTHWWSDTVPPLYSPGVLVGRGSIDGSQTCGFDNQPPSYAQSSLTRLTYIGSDGTEFELVDQATGGQPENVLCNSPGFSRGRVFVTRDGTAAKFVADSPILDSPFINMPHLTDPSGYLIMRDGLRYRIDLGLVTSIRDRNGNTITLTYTSGELTQVTDSLQRVITIQHLTNSDQIVYPGFAGAQRTIQINYAALGSVLATSLDPGYVLKVPGDLFGSYGGDTQNLFNPEVVSSVLLPDLTRQYQFFYNSFAELVQVKLPTGGEYRYRYGPGSVISAVYNAGYPFSYRRVTQRQVYRDGSTLEGQTAYSVAVGITTYNGVSYPRIAVTADHQDATAQSVTQDVHFFYGDPANPEPEQGLQIPYANWKQGREYQTDEKGPNGTPLLRSTSNSWSQRICGTGEACPSTEGLGVGQGGSSSTDPRIDSTATTLSDTGQVSSVSYGYDRYNNVTSTFDYDFGSTSSPLRQTQTVYVTSTAYTADAINLVSLPQSVTVSGSLGPTSVTQYEYDCYGGGCTSDANHAALLDRPNIVQLDAGYAFSAGNTTRGNVTQIKRTLDTPSSILSTWTQYDIAGSTVKTIDAKNNSTTISYASYGNSYAFPNIIINGLNQAILLGFDFNLGKPTFVTDRNLWATNYNYAEPLDRLVWIARPDGGSTVYNYLTPDTNTVHVEQNQFSCGSSAKIITETSYDGLGRKSQVRQLGDPAGTITTQYNYDALGRLNQVSNPYRQETPQYTTTYFDALSRPVKVLYPDNAVAVAAYSGNVATSRDPADKWKQTTSDALGRLKSVTEDPTASITVLSQPYSHASVFNPLLVTSYTYTHQDDLLTVCQNCLGTPVNRSFTYDSLRRLRSAFNPESGFIQYDYDNNGNLKTRLDGRNITTTYQYDALNRITSKTYSDGKTGPSAYCYDGDRSQPGCSDAPNDYSLIFNLQGRITRAQTKDTTGVVTSTTTYPNYDRVGRVLWSTQLTNGLGTYIFQYTYNLAGSLETLTYPSTHAVKTCYDAVGRPQSVAKTTGGTPYAVATAGPDPDNPSNTLQAFTPHGAPQRLVLGNGIVEAVQYNNRLQPVSISAALAGTRRLRLSYGYGAANNGNVVSETIETGSLSLPRSYGYDALNRLQVATETGPASWQETSAYDRVGNRWVDVNSTYGIAVDSNTPKASTWYNANNQIVGSLPDAAGNQQLVSPFILTYDAENRITKVEETVSNSTFTVATYQYDADGRRVSKTAPSGQTVYFYGAGGDLLAEYGLVTDSGTTYLTADHLGSTRLLTDSNGGVKKRYDYEPFGEELLAGINGRTTPDYNAPNNAMPPDVMSRKFTGQERDAETGLDYFGARSFSGPMGRFTSPDQPLQDQEPSDPQSWNLYSYVRNNPLKYIDPTGEDCIYTNNFSSDGNVSVERGNCSKKGGTFIDGTIDFNSITYNARKNELGYNFANDAAGTGGAGTLGLPARQQGELSPYGQRFYNEMSMRRDDSNHFIAGFVAADAVFAALFASTYAGPALYVALTAGGSETGAIIIGKKMLDGTRTVDSFLSGTLKTSRSYFSEYGSKTLNEVENLAAGGDPKAAKMLKLVKAGARLQEKVGGKQ